MRQTVQTEERKKEDLTARLCFNLKLAVDLQVLCLKKKKKKLIDANA